LEIPQNNRKLGRPRCRWENNIKKYLEEIRWSVVEWIAAGSEYSHMKGYCLQGNESLYSMKCREFDELRN